MKILFFLFVLISSCSPEIVKPYPAPDDFYETDADYQITSDDSNQTEVVIEDQNLLTCIRNKFNITEEKITREVVEKKSRTSLTCSNMGIVSLNGLENFVMLTYLDVSGNKLNRIDTISSLYNLVELNVNDCGVSSLEPLRHILLDKLYASRNNLGEIDALRNQSWITKLDLSYNNIYDFSPILYCSSLYELNIKGQVHANVFEIGDLPKFIVKLDASNNKISNIDLLSYYAFLKNLNLSENNLLSLKPLEKLLKNCYYAQAETDESDKKETLTIDITKNCIFSVEDEKLIQTFKDNGCIINGQNEQKEKDSKDCTATYY